MAELLIPDIEEALVARFKAEAQRHGRTLEEEVRCILAAAVRPACAHILAEFAEIRAMEQPGVYPAVEDLVRQDRERR